MDVGYIYIYTIYAIPRLHAGYPKVNISRLRLLACACERAGSGSSHGASRTPSEHVEDVELSLLRWMNSCYTSIL